MGVFVYADSDTVYTYGFLNYVIVNDAIKIVNYFGNERDVSVPNAIAGYPVSSIGENAFVNTNAKNVYLPDTIMFTETGAFGKDVTVIYSDGKNQYESNHTWDEGVIEKYPTCSESGTIVYTCALCKATKVVTLAKLANHTYDSACDAECNVCGFKRNVTHTPGELKYDENEHFNFCTVCGEKINAEKHIEGRPATETSPCRCTVCSYIIKPAAPHTHSLVLVAAVSAACTESGNKEYYKCDGCGEIFSDANGNDKINYSDVIIKPTGHTVVIDDAVPSTVNSYGKTSGSHCSVCGKVLIEQKVLLPISKAIEKSGSTVLSGTHSVIKSKDGNNEVSYVNNDEVTGIPDVDIIIDDDGVENESVVSNDNKTVAYDGYDGVEVIYDSKLENEPESLTAEGAESSDTAAVSSNASSDTNSVQKNSQTVWIVAGICVVLVIAAAVIFYVYKHKKSTNTDS